VLRLSTYEPGDVGMVLVHRARSTTWTLTVATMG
jgi:hypothetical protein